MNALVLNKPLEFTLTQCASCGLDFALPAFLEKKRREDHGRFFCPNGHPLVFDAKTDAEKLREELERTRKDLGVRLSEANERANRAEAEASSSRQRARGGLCPCCKRSFTQLRRHMANKHPAFGRHGAKNE